LARAALLTVQRDGLIGARIVSDDQSIISLMAIFLVAEVVVSRRLFQQIPGEVDRHRVGLALPSVSAWNETWDRPI
jgi:hypothetical protein